MIIQRDFPAACVCLGVPFCAFLCRMEGELSAQAERVPAAGVTGTAGRAPRVPGACERWAEALGWLSAVRAWVPAWLAAGGEICVFSGLRGH